MRQGDVVTVDVTATNVPAATAMIGFSYRIEYDESRVWVETQDQQFLLAATPGSGLLNGSQPTPDQDLNNEWIAAVADLSNWGIVLPEYGSGVLSRLSISISQSAQDGTYGLTLTAAAHVDLMGGANVPDALNSAAIAVGVSCPILTGTPTPVPTATPPATPTPRPRALSVSFEPEVRLRVSDASVTISGTVTCSAPAAVEVDVAVQQFVRGASVIAALPNSVPVACNGQTPWSATMRPEGGRFRPGYGEAVVIAFAPGSGGVGASGPVHLKPGAVK